MRRKIVEAFEQRARARAAGLAPYPHELVCEQALQMRAHCAADPRSAASVVLEGPAAEAAALLFGDPLTCSGSGPPVPLPHCALPLNGLVIVAEAPFVASAVAVSRDSPWPVTMTVPAEPGSMRMVPNPLFQAGALCAAKSDGRRQRRWQQRRVQQESQSCFGQKRVPLFRRAACGQSGCPVCKKW